MVTRVRMRSPVLAIGCCCAQNGSRGRGEVPALPALRYQFTLLGKRSGGPPTGGWVVPALMLHNADNFTPPPSTHLNACLQGAEKQMCNLHPKNAQTACLAF